MISPSPARLLVPLALAALATTAGGVDPAPDLKGDIEDALGWVTSATPGCAIAIVHGERVVQVAYGAADLANEVPLTTDTLFDAGSVVKQFVAAAVLLLIDDGRCELGDDVRKYIPELPEYGHVITIDHLLTHTSGLRDWTGLRKFSSVDEDALTMILRQRGLDFVPGEEWSYSNSGYVLLKELVARVSEKSFGEFAHDRIFEPLGMESTTYAADPDAEREGLAVAYERSRGGDWTVDVLTGNDRGGGGALLSTVGDLVKWNVALRNGSLGELVTKKLEEPARLSNGRKLGYTRGLFLEDIPARRVFWHTGSAGSFKALLNRFPEYGLSIAILSNAGEAVNRMELTRVIKEQLLPAEALPEVEVVEVEAAAKKDVDVKPLAGLFLNERTGDPLRLIAHRGQLRVLGGPELDPVAEGRFRAANPVLSFHSEDEFEIRFTSDDTFELVSMEDETTRYRRGDPGSLTAKDLQAYAGSFESDELKAVLDVAVDAEHLTLQINGSRPLPFQPVDRDAFQFRRFFVRFDRDEEGQVQGLKMTNPVMRHVPFARASGD